MGRKELIEQRHLVQCVSRCIKASSVLSFSILVAFIKFQLYCDVNGNNVKVLSMIKLQ